MIQKRGIIISIPLIIFFFALYALVILFLTTQPTSHLQQYDLSAVTYLHKLYNPELNTFSEIISSKLFLVPFFIIICATIYFYDRKNAKKIIFILLIAILLNLLIAQLLIKETSPLLGKERLRPYLIEPQIEPIGHPYTDSSFPSFHTTIIVTLSAILFYFYHRSIFISLPFIILLSFSRMHNGMHYPTDIIAGIILGILLALSTIQLSNYFLKQKKIKRFVR